MSSRSGSKEVKQRLAVSEQHIELREESGTLMDFATTLVTTLPMPTVMEKMKVEWECKRMWFKVLDI